MKDFEIKLKNLESVTNLRVESTGQFITITRDSIVTRIVEKDTVRTIYKVINYREPSGWYSMTGTINGDSLTIKSTFKNDFAVAVFKERKEKRYWLDFFRGKHTVAKVINRNSYSSTQDFRVIVKEPRKRFLGIF